MILPVYGWAIENALRNGYRVDTAQGTIYGLKGLPLKIALHGAQRYPTVPLVVVGMGRRYYVVPAHKVIAFALWGEEAFAPGIHVRHGPKGVLDISSQNLKLGSASENEQDKPSEVRSMVGAIARSHQSNLVNAKLTWPQVHELRAEHRALRTLHPKKFPNGVASALAAKYRISQTNIIDITKGNTWKIPE